MFFMMSSLKIMLIERDSKTAEHQVSDVCEMNDKVFNTKEQTHLHTPCRDRAVTQPYITQ